MKKENVKKNKVNKGKKKTIQLDYVMQWMLAHGHNVIHLEKDKDNPNVYELDIITPDMF